MSFHCGNLCLSQLLLADFSDAAASRIAVGKPLPDWGGALRVRVRGGPVRISYFITMPVEAYVTDRSSGERV